MFDKKVQEMLGEIAFEEKAEKWADKMYPCDGQAQRYLFMGAKFGYNKANEWHYVKDELPEKEKFILIYTDLKNVYIARLVEDDYFITNKGGFVQTSSVIAWKEIILPKEEE